LRLPLRHVRSSIAALALCAVIPASASALAPPLTTTIVTGADPTVVPSGGTTAVSGVLSPAAGRYAGVLLELQADQGPGRSFVDIAHTITGAGGEYAFTGLRPFRDTRYRVLDREAPEQAGPVVEVAVERPAYPSSARLRAAGTYLARRAGVGAFAVLDSEGRLSGLHIHERFTPRASSSPCSSSPICGCSPTTTAASSRPMRPCSIR
jgi:hypothetical protein